MFCTILTSDSELIDSTYIVTPTSTGGPEIVWSVLFSFLCIVYLINKLVCFWFLLLNVKKSDN